MNHRTISRRSFVASSAAVLAYGCGDTRTGQAPDAAHAPSRPATTAATRPATAAAEPIIDIHQHTNYAGRTDEQLIAHQQNMGVTTTILLPAGRPVSTPTTHAGKSNGLAAQAGRNESCYAIARERPGQYYFFANEVSDLPDARAEIEKYLKLGAIGIGEQKFGIDVESGAADAIAGLAKEYGVPVLNHFQVGMYNHGYDRFHRVLEKYPAVNFIGHAQTVWANVDRKNVDDPKSLYPKTPVTPGGITDRYLRDYPNFFADISAGSGLNALNRDLDHARTFLKAHQDKILYGSDCNDRVGKAPLCQGAMTIVAIKRLAADKAVERKILHGNAARLFRIA